MGEDQKSTAEMIADFMREAAVLCAVFIPMDRIVSKGEPFTTKWFYTRYEPSFADIGNFARAIEDGKIVVSNIREAQPMEQYYPVLVLVVLGAVLFPVGLGFALNERKQSRLKKLREEEERRRQSEFDFGRKDNAQRTA